MYHPSFLKVAGFPALFKWKITHSAKQCAPILPALQPKCNNRAPAEVQIASLHPHGVLTSHTGIHHSRAYLPGQLVNSQACIPTD